MKRILVLSDSHGNVNNMVIAVRNEKPDMIIHLGDCWADAEQLLKKFPEILLERVPGNCDCPQAFEERVLMIEGKRVLICHGHTFNVKAGYLGLSMGAQAEHADAALFGHTHCVYQDFYQGITYLNPGSIGAPPYGVPPSYGILRIDGASDLIDTDIVYME